MNQHFYPIGVPGKPWGDAEKAQWRARQVRQRSYADDVLASIDRLRGDYEIVEYGTLAYDDERFPVLALRNRGWQRGLPVALVTGGMHGYETSGVHGALHFMQHHGAGFVDRINLLVVPCVSPWAYERIHRWNADAVDPNRSFREPSPAAESAALMRLVAPLEGGITLHIDLHETTDTDESEFRPALAARDGREFHPGTIPDGFYLCADTQAPAPEFQQAVLAAVAEVTHIAPSDPDGTLIGSPVVAPGVIEYAYRELGLCAGVTDAPFRTTTEVYPDSPRATADQCNAAQAAAICGALNYVLARA